MTLTPDRCPTCGSPVLVVTADEGTSHYEPAPLLSVIFHALTTRGWMIRDGVYVDPDGNQYGNVEGAITAQTFREIGEA